MSWLVLMILLEAVLISECQNKIVPTEDELKSLLHDAMAEVLASHSEEMSKSYSPPYFEAPNNFMRSFRPGTGVSNREELKIESINPLAVYSEFQFFRFVYKRFNNTDYVVGISDSEVVLVKIHPSTDGYLVLSLDDTVSKYVDHAATVKDVSVFTRFIDYVEALFIAVLVETPKTSIVNVFEVIGNRWVVVAMIDLKPSRANSRRVPHKLSYVQSSHGGSLVVLVESDHGIELNYKQEGSSKLNHYIEVNYPNALHLETFTIHGHGYVAVANRTFCDIFKLNENSADHLFFDRIGPLSNIQNLKYLRIGFHHILAVVHSDGVQLFNWRSGEFAEKQNIALPGVVQLYCSKVESCRDEVILIMIKGDGNSVIYGFSGQQEIFVKLDAVIPGGHLIASGSVTSYTNKNKVVLLFSSFQKDLKALVIETSLTLLRDPLLVEGESVSHVMKGIKEMLQNQTNEIKHIKQVLKSAVRQNGNQTIFGVQHFQDLSTTTGAVVEQINQFVLEWEDSKLTLEEYRRGAEDLEKEVEKLEKLVMEIEHLIPDLVSEDESAVITGQKIFAGNVFADTLVATSINIGEVADMNLKQLQEQVYRLDKPQEIDGTLVFKEPLKITGNLDVEGTVNGIDISRDVMTAHSQQLSKAQMVFMNKLLVNHDVDVKGKINNVDINKEVVTLTGSHHITGRKEFLNGIDANEVQTVLLDGNYVDEIYKRAFTKSGNQNITTDITFSEISTNDIVLKGLLNGHKIQDMVDNIVRVDRPAHITGLKTFMNNILVNGALTVRGTVNGLQIPDDLFLTDQSKPVTGTKEFLGHFIANDINVAGKVDGLRLPQDVITLSGNDEVSNTLYFVDGIAAEKNIVVEGLVDGIDISEIARQAMQLNETNSFEHAVFLGPVTISGDLTVNGLLNKVDLAKLVRDMVFKDEYPAEINSKKIFKKITAEKVKLHHSINGYNIDVDFMKVRGDQLINGTKTFKKEVSLNSIYVDDGMIGNLNVSEIYSQRIGLAVDDSDMEHTIEFVDHVIVNGDLVVHGKVAGLSFPDDVLLRNSAQEIANKHFADKVVVDNLIVNGDISVKKFAGKDLIQFFKDRITLTTDQDIPGDLIVGKSTIAKLSVSGLVNLRNFTDFAKNVMSKTKPQNVTAVKEFLGDVSVREPITTLEGVNGYRLSDINRRAFKLLEDNLVTAPIVLDESVSISDLVVTGNINNVNLAHLVEDSLKKSGGQYIKGDTVFNAGFHVVGDILATDVNGLNIPFDVLLKAVPQEIVGQFTFESMGINGDLLLNRNINGLDLSEISPHLARIEAETVVESNITFSKPIHVHDNIEVTGKVNDVDLKQLFDNVLRKTGNQTIAGHKVFRGNVTILGDIDVQHVNGFNWREFLDDVVWIHVPQVIRSPKTFEGHITVEKNVLVSGNVHVNEVNGIDLHRFINEAVYIDVPTHIPGPVIFKNPVEIMGDLNAELINGLRLKKDVVTIACVGDGPQIITGQKTFQTVKVFGDIIAASVNSYDLQELYNDTLMTEGNQTVVGDKYISGDVVFKKDVHPETVNGIMLKSDLVTLHTNQEILGPVQFHGDLFVEKDMLIKGLLNDVDIQNISRDSVYLRKDQVIDGTYSIQSAVVSSNVDVHGLVNGIDFQSFDRNVTEFLMNTKDTIKIMNMHVQDHCELVNFLQESLTSSYYALDGFVIHEEFEHPASFIHVKSKKELSLLYLGDAAMATSVLNVWDEKTRLFHKTNTTTTSIVRCLTYSVGRLRLDINIGINTEDSSVTVRGFPAGIPSGFIDASVVVQKEVAIVALLFPLKDTCDVYLVQDNSEGNSAQLDASLVIGKRTTSLTMFELSGILYIAFSIAFSHSYIRGSSEVYSRTNGNWQRVQHIPTYSSSLVKHFAYHGYHYLAFSNNAPVYETKEPMSIQIYRNAGPNELMFSLFQRVPFDDVKGMELFQYGDLSQLHVVAWNESKIQIFGLEGESGLRPLFTIHGKCVKDVKPLLIANDIYLAVGQQNLLSGEETRSILYRGITNGYKYQKKDLYFC